MTSSVLSTLSRVAAPPVDDRKLLRGAIVLALLGLLGFGLLYSLAGVGLGQALFPAAANGSLVERDGRVVGAESVAQPFVSAGYFQPRPSAADYDLTRMAGSNQALSHPLLHERIAQSIDEVARRDGVDRMAVPADLVTQSGAGIDPHISPAGAAIQVDRVARARGWDRASVEHIVAAHTEGRQLGLLGAPRVNVLLLNLALDARPADEAPASTLPAKR